MARVRVEALADEPEPEPEPAAGGGGPPPMKPKKKPAQLEPEPEPEQVPLSGNTPYDALAEEVKHHLVTKALLSEEVSAHNAEKAAHVKTRADAAMAAGAGAGAGAWAAEPSPSSRRQRSVTDLGGDPPKDMMKAQGARHAASLWKVAKEKSAMEVELRKAREAKAAIAAKAKELLATEIERKEELDGLAEQLHKERELRGKLEQGVMQLEQSHESEKEELFEFMQVNLNKVAVEMEKLQNEVAEERAVAYDEKEEVERLGVLAGSAGWEDGVTLRSGRRTVAAAAGGGGAKVAAAAPGVSPAIQKRGKRAVAKAPIKAERAPRGRGGWRGVHSF
jgi:hypothetical protein